MANIELLLADATDLVLGALLGPQWGIYYQGVPVISPATVANQVVAGALQGFQDIASFAGLPNIVPVTASLVDFNYKQDWPISTYPQEEGAFQSYNKVTLPWDVQLKIAAGGTASNRRAFLNTTFAIAGGLPPGAPVPLPGSGGTLPLFDIVTPELTYPSCSCTHIDFSRSAQRGVTLIVVDIWFQQIAVTSATTFQNTQQPGEAGQQGIGNVQPSTPSQAVQANISAQGLY